MKMIMEMEMMEMAVSMRVIVFSNEQCIYLQLFVLSIKNTKAASRTFLSPSPVAVPFQCLALEQRFRRLGKRFSSNEQQSIVHGDEGIVSAGNALLIAVRKVLATARWIMSNKLSTRGQGGPARLVAIAVAIDADTLSGFYFNHF